MNRKIVRLALLFSAVLWPQWGRAMDDYLDRYDSEPQGVMTFYFANNSSMLMRDYRSNDASLSKLDRILRNPDIVSLLDSVVVEGGASMVGSLRTNYELSRARAEAVRGYIRWRHPQVASAKIRMSWNAVNWKELYRLVENDPFVPYRNEVRQIALLPISELSKVSQIQLLSGAEAYIQEHFSRYMRSATCVVFFFKRLPEEPLELERSSPQEPLSSGLIPPPGSPTPSGQGPVSEGAPVVLEPSTPSETGGFFKGVTYTDYVHKPLLALKTNLLFDAVSALNLELEVPIGRRWSVAVEGIFPWWLWEKEQYCLQVLSGNVEGRLWFGNRDKRPQLTGWFAGVYAGGGYYDLEWKERGYQGEFFIAGGLSGGYAHTVNKAGTLRMEYSLGVGYMRTNYREYVPHFGLDDEWHLVRQQSGTFTWIGPTRAKVSLVWLIHHGYQKKGGLL